MLKRQKRTVVLALIILMIVLVVDQVSKSFVQNRIAYGEQIVFSDGFILTHVTNGGFFMSVGDNVPDEYRYWMVCILSFVTITWFIYRVWKNFSLGYFTAVGIALLIGGALGNFLDRIIAGGVTDFMYIEFVSFKSSIFNVADVSIFFGLLLLIIRRLKMTFETEIGNSAQTSGKIQLKEVLRSQ